jgi:putative ABC transport system ATP-binding protein
MNTLSMNNVSFSYPGATRKVLSDVNAEFESGKIYTIVGESGTGKTTLLSLIAGLTDVSAGEIQYKETNIKRINKNRYRSNEIGVIFQSYNLLITDTAVENVMLSIHLSGNKVSNKKAVAYRLLEKVGINHETADRRILKLSGGEQQRVAIARSLSCNPNLIIADEPTGNLDSKNESIIMGILQGLAHEDGKCVIIVTHSKSVTEYSDEVFEITGGILKSKK